MVAQLAELIHVVFNQNDGLTLFTQMFKITTTSLMIFFEQPGKWFIKRIISTSMAMTRPFQQFPAGHTTISRPRHRAFP